MKSGCHLDVKVEARRRQPDVRGWSSGERDPGWGYTLENAAPGEDREPWDVCSGRSADGDRKGPQSGPGAGRRGAPPTRSKAEPVTDAGAPSGTGPSTPLTSLYFSSSIYHQRTCYSSRCLLSVSRHSMVTPTRAGLVHRLHRCPPAHGLTQTRCTMHV